jgi:endonuclease/exonuclease/phosphatase family metal-dependent hydrolase
MRAFKILTLNIHKGFSLGNRRFTLERIRQNLRQSGSNLVFLQEVVGEHERHREAIVDWPATSQFEFLADSVWDHYAYGKNAIYQHGHHGNAILSELPFDDYSNVNISTMKISQRGILHGVLVNGVHLLCVHLGLFERERRAQIRRLIDHIETRIPAGEPLILAGDFNDWLRTGHRALRRHCGLVEVSEASGKRLAATYPAMLPMLPMDRIYLRGFHVQSSRVLADPEWRWLSDHCAVVANVVLEN